MSGVEAGIGIGVQDVRVRQPPVEDLGERLPFLSCALTAANQNVSPESISALSEGAQLIDVAGYRVVLVIAEDDLP